MGSGPARPRARILARATPAWPAVRTPRAADAMAALSPREQEVLQRLRTGSSNAEIAADLHNSVRTIEHHVSAILAKLGLRSRAEAAVYAASIETAQPLKADA